MQMSSNGAAALVIHGFTATPYSIAYQAQALQTAGYHVVTPLLPGHGTFPNDMDAVTWQHWASCIADHFDELAAIHRQVVVVGQSLGGLLALHLAAHRRNVAAVVSLAAPLWLEGTPARAAKWTAAGGILGRLPWIPKLGGSDVRDPAIKANDTAYRRVSTKALRQLTAFMNIVDGELPSVTAPLLVIHSEKDHTAPVACALRVASGARAVRVKLLHHSFHLIAVDIEKDVVASEIKSFLAQFAPAPGNDDPQV
jgi:carboxylesterase